jgi:hypothetical protein
VEERPNHDFVQKELKGLAVNLSFELRKAGIEWSIDQLILQEESQRYPGKFNEISRTRVRFADWNTVEKDSGQVPVTLEKLYHPSQEFAVQKYLALGLRDLLPKHPIRREYLYSVGNTPVTISPEHLGESLGEIIHVQLRKCMDSKESSIQHNGIQHLLPADWGHMLRLIRECVTELQDEAKEKRRPLLRREVGMVIKNAMTERMKDVQHRDFEKNRKSPKRTALQEFALRSVEAMSWLTDDDDWTFGWTSYLCEDVEDVVQDAETKNGAVAA